MPPASEKRNRNLVATAHCFVTKDGRWVQLLGAELPRHIKRTLAAFGVSKLSLAARAAPLLVNALLVGKQRSTMEKLVPVLGLLNDVLYHAAKRVSRFIVWFFFVNTHVRM